MKRLFWIILSILMLLIITFMVIARSNQSEQRHPDALHISPGIPGPIMAGFSAVKITPEVPDRWTDTNGDAVFKKKDGDTWTDGNRNGKFDAVWIAGFSNAKAANGIHDELWARTMVLDDGHTRVSYTVLDVIGLSGGHIAEIRKMLPASAGITHAIISATHTHEGPDLLGLWGKTPFRSGINKEYLEFVKKQTQQSILDATKSIRPVRLEFSEDATGAGHLHKDTRLPEIFDSGLRMIRAVDGKTGKTIGTLTVWGNHPETLWNKNLLVSSDFCHYVREGVEKGVSNGDTLKMAGTGGIALYATGAVGGLMTTHPSIIVKDPFSGQEFQKPSFEKAEAQGKQLSLLILKAMEKPAMTLDSASLSLSVRTFNLPIKNKLFRLGLLLGVLDRETEGWMKTETEVNLLQLGPVSILTIPGEIYPELVNGGVEAPEEGDFGLSPQEVPTIREMMPGQFKFVIGLANDEIGYIIPKSQWDTKPPYAYGREKPQYGEENSLGPETAPIIHQQIKDLLQRSGEK
ncbi:MAG TPA: neutral/alkaline non-lysosomal ceramidase N-terminal domain-containing protein [Prolixibacteraceae bacterium]|nr:neutral/alkaline non-lysosomal ceramidase N-terminal domain-containing protein [Prolixibacteraceae bacterium]